jgi:acyl-coenzyme A synthetase/AMP-(fatty) acid ligase
MIFQLRHLFQQIMPLDRAATIPGVLDNARVTGLFINAFCGLGVGIENVLAPTTNIDLLLDAFNRHSFDILLTVPTVLTRMLAHPQFHHTNLSHLRFANTMSKGPL